jgi:hypothetical protein
MIRILSKWPHWGKVRSWLSAVWIALVLGFAIWALIRQPVAIADLLNQITIGRGLAALALIVLGKFLVIALVRATLCDVSEDRDFGFAWWTYSMADVAKYLPGGIWGFAGRLGLYKGGGISLRRGGRALTAETVLLLVFSLGLGAVALALHRAGEWLLQAAIVLGYLAAMFAVTRLALPRLTSMRLTVVVAQQTLAWIFFGGSFALLITAHAHEIAAWLGVFDIGFAAGTAAIFAPSGLGVREAVVGWLAGRDMLVAVRTAVEVTIVHRLIWMVADFLVLGGILLARACGLRSSNIAARDDSDGVPGC